IHVFTGVWVKKLGAVRIEILVVAEIKLSAGLWIKVRVGTGVEELHEFSISTAAIGRRRRIAATAVKAAVPTIWRRRFSAAFVRGSREFSTTTTAIKAAVSTAAATFVPIRRNGGNVHGQGRQKNRK
ncbi:MAG: hypothetical protein V3T65_04605, partial [Acidobacteriota bacterium]